MPIAAGELDKRITLRTRTRTIDPEFGSDVEAWASVGLYAKVIESPGREYVAGTVGAEGRAVFLIRKRDGVDSTAEVVWKGRTYGVEDVTEAGSDGLMLHAIARKDDAN